MKTRVERFREVAEDIAQLYEAKDRCYGDSFGATYERLGIVSAVTRISDKYNRLCNLVTMQDLNVLGESLEDTLKDLAAYAIMTLAQMKQNRERASRI
jgi:hypothetical protein